MLHQGTTTEYIVPTIAGCNCCSVLQPNLYLQHRHSKNTMRPILTFAATMALALTASAFVNVKACQRGGAGGCIYTADGVNYILMAMPTRRGSKYGGVACLRIFDYILTYDIIAQRKMKTLVFAAIIRMTTAFSSAVLVFSTRTVRNLLAPYILLHHAVHHMALTADGVSIRPKLKDAATNETQRWPRQTCAILVMVKASIDRRVSNQFLHPGSESLLHVGVARIGLMMMDVALDPACHRSIQHRSLNPTAQQLLAIFPFLSTIQSTQALTNDQSTTMYHSVALLGSLAGFAAAQMSLQTTITNANKCPDGQAFFQQGNNAYHCCPGSWVVSIDDNAYCCVGGAAVTFDSCFPFCTTTTASRVRILFRSTKTLLRCFTDGSIFSG
ncbi:uncharacterized protein MYCFIDRAFT_174694 [Pseudocercospora fijiensis CIRAD86]|uniref:Uncharacterized protein n=1 Tax=Pseudocercospora fijiensis (strain CIRAD86) TaxID=383855 RepID=M2Z041_PSEFD|nr:uncharacterized protein MYCFIDRAFT_174694 [Pseudocercospora fijiensis CIRAD86]EME83220.1 hypothetical protein MYCFIDRAFT_174694 [Pseudocercospora fijiensis CIRAD86]